MFLRKRNAFHERRGCAMIYSFNGPFNHQEDQESVLFCLYELLVPFMIMDPIIIKLITRKVIINQI